MDVVDRIAKVEFTWCIACKRMNMLKNATGKGKYNGCHIVQQMKASVYHHDTLPKEINLHKVMCSKFDMKRGTV